MPKGAKHALAALSRKIHQLIVDAFTHIKENDEDEVHIRKTLKQLAQGLETHWEQLNAVHIATLLNQLSNLEISNSSLIIDFMDACLKKCLVLLKALKAATDFTSQHIAQIFNALPKLPVLWEEHKDLRDSLLTHALFLAEQKKFNADECAHILGAIVKLQLNLHKRRLLIKNLLDIFEASQAAFHDLDIIVLNELWQFCMIAKAETESARIDQLIIFIENALKEKEREVIIPSKLHTQILKYLTPLLAPEFKIVVLIEHPVGAYSLDIAFLERKLNIEIDGPHHYCDGELKRVYRFRDKLLEAHADWKTIRIPHFEWQALTSKEAKRSYLCTKLASHFYIFDHDLLLSALEWARLQKAQEESSAAATKGVESQETSALPSTTQLIATHGIFQVEVKATERRALLLDQKTSTPLTTEPAEEEALVHNCFNQLAS